MLQEEVTNIKQKSLHYLCVYRKCAKNSYNNLVVCKKMRNFAAVLDL